MSAPVVYAREFLVGVNNGANTVLTAPAKAFNWLSGREVRQLGAGSLEEGAAQNAHAVAVEPVTGDVGCGIVGAVGGLIGGAAAGAFVGAVLFSAFLISGGVCWGVGENRLDDDDSGNDDEAKDLVLAGKVLSYVGVGGTALGTLIGSVVGGIALGIKGAEV